eukprot:UN24602
MEYKLDASNLPSELHGQYSKLQKGNITLYLKLDENLRPLYSISKAKTGRWDLKDLTTDEFVASTKSLKGKKNSWIVNRRASHHATGVKKHNTRQGAKRKRNQIERGQTKKTRRRAFGQNLLQTINNSQLDDSDSESLDTLALDMDICEPLECDIANKNKERYCGAFVKDIMKCLKENELRYVPLKGYMKSVQSDIKVSMRYRLLDWLSEVQEKFSINGTSFHLAVNLLDRYLSLVDVPRTKLQLLGCVVLWLAAKYNEIRVPEVEDFVYMSDGAFVGEDMLALEEKILTILKFDFSVPTAYHFGERYIDVVKYYLYNEKSKKRLGHLVHYYLEHCLLQYKCVGVKPSLLAAAATFQLHSGWIKCLHGLLN